MKILIVDDREDNLYFLRVLLSGNGFEVEIARNGAEALASLAVERCDLIISDILMPIMDGFQLCRMIRKEVSLKDIPLIFYTATYTGPQDESFALQVGATRFVRKPCEPDVMIEIIREILEDQNQPASHEVLHEEEVLKLYNERLVRKLEQKMLELEVEVQARKSAEKILRQSEEKYRLLYHSIRDAILVVDTQMNVLDCNPAFVELFGYLIEDIDRKKSSMICESEEEFQQLVDALKDGSHYGGMPHSANFIRKDGMVFPGEVNFSHFRRDDGEVTGLIWMIRDVSERVAAQKVEKILESRLQHAQKMEAVGRLAAGVAHDFNNMLGIIVGYADVILCQIGPDNPVHRYIVQMSEAGQRSVGITQQLLAFSRQQPIAPSVVCLNRVIESRLKMIRLLAREDISVNFIGASDLWNVKIDVSQIDQLLLNLVVNAKDAIIGSGSITIETKNSVHFPEAVCAYSDIPTGEFVALSVADSGSGIDSETISHIFEPFFTTKGDVGTGLGLATVHGIVQQNGGTIAVHSELGKGAIFTIFLPRFDGASTS